MAKIDEDDWLSDFHVLHSNPILALEDGAYVRYGREGLQVIRGNILLLEKRQKQILLNSKF